MSAPDRDVSSGRDLDDFDGLGVEAPEADTLDQHRTADGPADPRLEPAGEPTMEANEADVLDQRQVVPIDDREV